MRGLAWNTSSSSMGRISQDAASTNRSSPDAIMAAVIDGTRVGLQGMRPVYEVQFDGQTQLIAVTVADNGFVVGANPATR